jgi:hypothetical protein
MELLIHASLLIAVSIPHLFAEAALSSISLADFTALRPHPQFGVSFLRVSGET